MAFDAEHDKFFGPIPLLLFANNYVVFVITIIILTLISAAAWLTSFVYCLYTLTLASVLLMLVDIAIFPIGIIHGIILWCRWIF